MAAATDPLSSDPALAGAVRRRGPLIAGAVLAGLVAGACTIAGEFNRGREVASLIGLIGGAAALAGLGLGCAWLVDGARARLAEALDSREKARLAGPTAATGLLTGAGTDHDLLVAGEERRLAVIATWGQAALALPLAALAAALPLSLRPGAAGDNAGELGLAVAAVIAGFPLLIIERRLHGGDAARFRETRHLARLLRLGVWTLVAGGGAAACRALDVEFAALIEWALLAVVVATAGELALRALATPFVPVARSGEARGLGDSIVTGLLLARGAGWGFGQGLKERFGIDLAQSWAVRFLAKAAVPLGAALLLLAWLLSGVTTLAPDERGVYERCGAPLAVLQPGLHAHLPWPFGVVRRIGFGRVHELALGATDEATAEALAPDADTPARFDRLWDRKHPSDATYLVPGVSATGPGRDGRAQQVGYQLLSSDVRVMWRVGASDAAALDHVYRVAKPAELVRGEALRLVQRALASRPLERLIGEDRDRLVTELRVGLQQRLDAARSGIEITALVVDAIHPPLAAVPAYHGVQAAEIGAGTDIARARGAAAATVAEAGRAAASRLANGTATAGEVVSLAKADVTRFDADRAAFDAAPVAMRLERWLQALGAALAKADLTLIDHRLPLDGGATIDLRRNPGTP